MRKRGYCRRRVSDWMSVTRRYCTETDKDIIKLFSRLCSPTTMVFQHHILLRNFNGKRSLSLGWT